MCSTASIQSPTPASGLQHGRAAAYSSAKGSEKLHETLTSTSAATSLAESSPANSLGVEGIPCQSTSTRHFATGFHAGSVAAPLTACVPTTCAGPGHWRQSAAPGHSLLSPGAAGHCQVGSADRSAGAQQHLLSCHMQGQGAGAGSSRSHPRPGPAGPASPLQGARPGRSAVPETAATAAELAAAAAERRVARAPSAVMPRPASRRPVVELPGERGPQVGVAGCPCCHLLVLM